MAFHPSPTEPLASKGLPRSRPAGLQAPNIKNAFAVSEGGAAIISPEANNAIVNQPSKPVGLTGGDISSTDQISSILGTPGRGLSSRFQASTQAPAFLEEAAGNPEDELLRTLLGGF